MYRRLSLRRSSTQQGGALIPRLLLPLLFSRLECGLALRLCGAAGSRAEPTAALLRTQTDLSIVRNVQVAPLRIARREHNVNRAVAIHVGEAERARIGRQRTAPRKPEGHLGRLFRGVDLVSEGRGGRAALAYEEEIR